MSIYAPYMPPTPYSARAAKGSKGKLVPAPPAGGGTKEGIAPAPGGGSAANPGTTPAGITIPTRPPVAGTDPIATPYDADQPLAQKAYDDAIAQIGTNQATTYLNYGVNPNSTTGQPEIDPASDPYGLFQQTQRQNADTSAQLHAASHSRGFFGGGIEGQAEEAGQLAAGQSTTGLHNALDALLTGYANQRTGAESDLNQRLLNDKLQGLQWLQTQQLMTPAAATRSDAQVQQLVNQAKAAWVKKFGGVDKKNKAGQTFQDRLNMYGAKLYDPTNSYMFAGQSFGG